MEPRIQPIEVEVREDATLVEEAIDKPMSVADLITNSRGLVEENGTIRSINSILQDERDSVLQVLTAYYTELHNIHTGMRRSFNTMALMTLIQVGVVCVLVWVIVNGIR